MSNVKNETKINQILKEIETVNYNRVFGNFSEEMNAQLLSKSKKLRSELYQLEKG